jgi:hypothetical protein
MAYVICGRLCEIKSLRKRLKMCTQSLGDWVTSVNLDRPSEIQV